MMISRLMATALLVFLLVTPAATAQDPPPVGPPDQSGLYAFHLEADMTSVRLDVDETVVIPIRFRDLSKDSTQGLSGGAAPQAVVATHQTRFEARALGDNPIGWDLQVPAPQNTAGGDVRELTVRLSAQRIVEQPVQEFQLVAISTAGGQRHESIVAITGITYGLSSFNAQVSSGLFLQPDQVVDVPVRITNLGLIPRGFSIEVAYNECGLQVATSTNNIVPPKTTSEYTVTLRAPGDQLWYSSVLCPVTLQVFPADAPSAIRTLQVSAQVNGFYVNPDWIVVGLAVTLVAATVLIFLARRKARVEEEILGKPPKPWTIPVEQVYLRHLKQQDERAWYIVRHHIMEEEYRSALDWYHAYKAATKGERTRERVVLKHEHRYERWETRWQARLDRPAARAERFAERLQAKLDRRARRDHAKAMRKHANSIAKLAMAHDKQQARLAKKHDVAVRKAAKKGLEAPEPFQPSSFEAPEEPVSTEVRLADHKWQRRADRRRARMDKKVARLEKRHARAENRYLRKTRRKVRRVARRLDDDAFIREHPLLLGE